MKNSDSDRPAGTGNPGSDPYAGQEASPGSAENSGGAALAADEWQRQLAAAAELHAQQRTGEALAVMARLDGRSGLSGFQLNGLGVLYFQAGEREKALDCFRRAVAASPGEIVLQKNLLDVSLLLQKWEIARLAGVRILEKLPEDPETLEKMGDLYSRSGDSGNARRYYQHLCRIDPTNQTVRQKLQSLAPELPAGATEDRTSRLPDRGVTITRGAPPRHAAFCAAPWTEGVLGADGSFHTCCRNGTKFGNWLQSGLREAWLSPAYQKFRDCIRKGVYPNEECRKCAANGTARSLFDDLHLPLQYQSAELFKLSGRSIPEISALRAILPAIKADDYTTKVLSDYFQALRLVEESPVFLLAGAARLVDKLVTLGRIVEDFLAGSLTPRAVAPFRQTRLIARCNARCIQCPGVYNGEVEHGGQMPAGAVAEAFSNPEDIIDFFMNGSEFLLYPGWKEIAGQLAGNGVKLSISTNGILLTESNIRYLVDHRMLFKLNVSLDGASRKTVEAIRRNVNYDRLLHHLSFLFEYSSEKRCEYDLSFSFVLMKMNFREFPGMVRLVHELRGESRHPRVNVFCQALEFYGGAAYQAFVHEQHHSLAPGDELEAVFREVHDESKRTGIPVSVFYSHPIADFIKQGFPFPALL